MDLRKQISRRDGRIDNIIINDIFLRGKTQFKLLNMAQDSKIEWTDHTANLWHGCTKVHEGCDNCYAETLAKRWGNDNWGNDKPRKEIKSVWRELKKMQEVAKKANEMHRVFVGSMMDIFEKPMSLIDSKGSPIDEYDTGGMRNTLFQKITDNYYPNLMFLLLTKRPSNINKYIPEYWKENPPQNIWFGTSVSDQKTANNLIPNLLSVKGNKFLSIEPQLGEIDLTGFLIRKEDLKGGVLHQPISWIIQGGESGHHKRPFNIDWARLMREQCYAAGVPYFFKQIDKVEPIPNNLLIREFPNFKSNVSIQIQFLRRAVTGYRHSNVR